MGFKKGIRKWARVRRMKRGRNGSMGVSKRPRFARRGRRVGRRRSRSGGAGLYQLKLKKPFADVLVTKHNYIQSEVASIPVGYTAVGTFIDDKAHKVWRTSMWDPDFNIGGHQPMFRDQLALQYNKVRVHGIKYTLTVQIREPYTEAPASSVKSYAKAPMGMVFIDMRPSGDTRAFTRDLWEDPRVRKYRVFGSKVINVYMPTARALGVTREDFLSDEDTIATVGANPVKMGFLNVYFHSSQRATEFQELPEWTITHNLVYYAQWSDRKVPTGS